MVLMSWVDDELLDTLRREPSDDASWAVWLDRLRDQGDPRADLCDSTEEARTEMLLEQGASWFGRPVRLLPPSRRRPGETAAEHRARLTGPNVPDTVLVEEEDAEVVARVHRGHVRHVVIRTGADTFDDDDDWPGVGFLLPVIARLLAHPVCSVLTGLTIRVTPQEEYDYEGLLDTIIESGAPLALRSVYIGDDDGEFSWTELPDVSRLWQAAPFLESLTLRGSDVTIGAPIHPRLQVLRIGGNRLSTEPVRALARADLPALNRLSLFFGEDPECTFDDVHPLLHQPFPSLRRLTLRTHPFGDQLLSRLHRAVWLGGLEHLHLDNAGVTDAGAADLIENLDAYASVKRLVLEDNELTEHMIGALETWFADRIVLD